MSMNTYPFDEKCVLLITKQLAAAILLQDILESDPDNDLAELPVKIQEKLANSTPWKCASDPELLELLDNDGWADISAAQVYVPMISWIRDPMGTPGPARLPSLSAYSLIRSSGDA